MSSIYGTRGAALLRSGLLFSQTMAAGPALALASAAVALSSPAVAEPVTFDAAVAHASEQAPSLQAGALEVQAQERAAVAAPALPDPKASLALENFPVTGPPAFNYSGDNMTMVRVGVSQEVPNLAQRHAQRARASADIGAAKAALSVKSRAVRVEAALAWIDLASADRQLRAVNEAIKQLASYREVASASIASGSARPAQALEVGRAVFALEDTRSELTAERSRAQSSLTRWTGDADPEATGPLPDFEVDADALSEAVKQHPDVGVAEAKVTQTEADIGLARAEKRPDWMFDVAYERRAPRYGDMVSAGVTVSLPLFARRRHDPVIAGRIAAAGAALAEQENERRRLHAELQASLADHGMHHEQLQHARTSLLPLAKQQVDLEVGSYAAGRASLVDVVAARTALLNAELLVLEREAAVARDGARLVLTYGGSK